MNDMNNAERLDSQKSEDIKVDGTSALKPEVDSSHLGKVDENDGKILNFDPARKEIGKIKNEVMNQTVEAVLPMNNTVRTDTAEGAFGRVIDGRRLRGRETDNTDGTDGSKTKDKKKLLIRIAAGAGAVLVAAAGVWGGVSGWFNKIFGGGDQNIYIPPTNTNEIKIPGVTPSEAAVTVSPSGEVVVVVPEVSTSPSPSVEVSPSPSPTESVDQEAAIIAQQKQDFIDGVGGYTPENMKDDLFGYGVASGKVFELGVVDIDLSLNQFAVQGWLFDYREENGNLVLEVGFTSKDNGKGIIKEIVIPVAFYQKYTSKTGIGFSFMDYESWQKFNTSMSFLGTESDITEIKNRLSDFKNKPMLFEFLTEVTVRPEDTELYGEEMTKDVDKLYNGNSSAVNQLLTEVVNSSGENFSVGSTQGADSSSLISWGVRACFSE
jgi:hypothetical protein